MMEDTHELKANRNFWLALLFTLITLGIYSWYLIYAFAKETNIACKEDGKHTMGLLAFLLLSLVTGGIFSIIWYYLWIERCNVYLVQNDQPAGLQVSTYLLTVFLFGALTLGVMFLVVYAKQIALQNAVNLTYNERNNFI